MAETITVKENLIDIDRLSRYDAKLKLTLAQVAEVLQNQIDAIKAIQATNGSVEGYIRVAGSSDPALSYKAYQRAEEFGGGSWRNVFYPCLVGTMLTGSSTVGKILYQLQKLGCRLATAADTGFTEGQAVWTDISGTLHAIDGSEGDVMIVNVAPYYAIQGQYEINGVTFDVFLRALNAFTYNDIEAEEIAPFGDSPDYCVSHTDTDNVARMHSVYNPAWAGSYSAPTGMAGKYVYSVDAETGDIVETYDDTVTLLGGSGGCHTADLDLPTGEQRAMNMNVNTAATVPFMNHTARSAELLWANLAAEGGTFDSHKAALFGSGFSANDAATAAADWAEDASGAKNGMKLVDKDGTTKYYSLGSDLKSFTGGSSDLYAGQLVNSWRNPWKVMEAYRALCYAIQNGVSELTWFVFEGNKYKWRSVEGYDGPAEGEATAVVWKQMSAKMTSRFVDPTDKETSLEGNRIDILVSVALYHGRTTQVSPSWWTSGLIFTEDENGTYEAYMQRDQSKLVKSTAQTVDVATAINFESDYNHVGTFTNGLGYRKNYSNDALMLPDSNVNKTGASLHTYVGGYNYFTGSAAAAGKKVVRGFRRGSYAYFSSLSPLYVVAYNAPSYSYSNCAFGTCCRIVTSV